MPEKYLGYSGVERFWSKVKLYVESQIEGGGEGGDGPSIGTATATPSSTSSSIQFTNLLGEPTSFIAISTANLATGASPYKVADVMFDGTSVKGNIITNTSNAQQTADSSGFSKSYSGTTLTIQCSSANFQTNEYKLVYTYGNSSNIDTKSVQVGSGATSISFTGLEDEPTFWGIVFTSNFATSSGYQRVISVANDGTSTFGLAMGSGAVASTAYWSSSYNNGTFTIQSSGTNAGGYFHQPGNYELLYSYGGSESGDEFEETDPIFTASAAHGISSSDISNWNSKQAALVSGTNIKTINNTSLLGSGNITISGGGGGITSEEDPIFSASAASGITSSDISNWNGKQTALVSGTNIKTINNQSLRGSGNIDVSGGQSTKTTWYGTCSTTAGTTAKVVTCSGFSLETGAIVAVLFSTANTAATPTLNVNSTGSIAIYVGSSTINSTTNVLKWSANTIIAFMYDGTYWRYLFSESAATVNSSRGAGSWYGACNSSASTSAKTCAIDNFVLTNGALITMVSSYANTYVSGKLTLNVNSTGAKDIWKGTTATSASNQLTWSSGDVLTFIYDASDSCWRYAGTSNPPSGGGGITSESDPIFSASAASGISSTDISNWNSKQAALVSGTNIKTINNNSLLGSGNITISGGGGGISLSDVYPVGSIYMSVNNVNPSTLFGGTWVQLQDAFLLGAGSTYSVNHVNDSTPTTDGGEASHKLTENETAVRAHTHGFTQPTISNHRHVISGDHTYNVTSSSNQGFSTGNYKIGNSGTTYNGFIRNTGTSNVLIRDSNNTQYEQPTATGGAVGARAYGSNDGESNVEAHNNMPPYMVVYIWKRTA